MKEINDGTPSRVSTLESFGLTPMARYVHSGNTEVVVSAVDVGTGVFTSVGHPLQNGDMVMPVLNADINGVYPAKVYQTPLANTAPYYVVNRTADTFKLSATSGGAAITLSANADIDLTKWHLETVPAGLSMQNLAVGKRCRVTVRGRIMLDATAGYLLPNGEGLVNSATNLFTHGTTFNYPTLPAEGSMFADMEFIVDWTEDNLTIKQRGFTIRNNSATAYATRVLNHATRLRLASQDINSLVFHNLNNSYRWAFANGTVIEVYKA
jgi:hypothetical protein